MEAKPETTKLTIRLPRRDVEYAKHYAKTHGINVTELIGSYMRNIRTLEQNDVTEELAPITGLVPRKVDVRETYRQHQLDKHQ